MMTFPTTSGWTDIPDAPIATRTNYMPCSPESYFRSSRDERASKLAQKFHYKKFDKRNGKR